MILALALAVTAKSSLMFKGYVAPHQASDGLRYRVVATQPQALPSVFRSCSIDDFAATDAGYQFAVTTSIEGQGKLPVHPRPQRRARGKDRSLDG